MAGATDRLLKRLERLRTKSNHMINDVSLDNEHTPFIASPSFKILCRKAMSVCIIDPLWRIVHLSVPELIKFLHEEEGYTCLNVDWLKSLPKILYELQTVLDCVSESRNWGILDTALNRNEIQTIGLLPNLEVLKLNVNACIGEIWGTSDMGLGFRKLKLLKLQDLDLVKWEASSGDFPRLQRLVVRGCSRLEEIPACIGEILTLELIEVSWCNESTAQSARRIQKEQERNGNDFLKVFTSVHKDQQGKRKRPSHDD